MITKSHVISIILILILSLSLMFSITGCQGDTEPLEDKTDQVKFRVSADKEIYIYPGDTLIFTIWSEKTNYMPGNPVYVWTVFYEGSITEEIIHEDYVKARPDEEYDYMKADEWPYTEELRYEFLSEGTYKFRVDLYDIDEYVALKNLAPRRGTHEFTVYCHKVTVSISVEPTGESREYTFKATFDNNKAVGLSDVLEWKFVNTKTGDIDKGKTETNTEPDEIYSKGTSEATHQFEKDGEYRITLSLKNYKGDDITTGETTLIVKGVNWIIETPTQPLKTGQEYTFTMRTDYPESIPDNPSYEWDFGDGSGITIPFSNEATHLYSEDGNYTVKVTIFDSSDAGASVLGVATVNVKVEASANHLQELHQMKQFALTFAVQHDYVEGMSGVFVWGWDSHGEVVWDGVNFSMEWDQYGHSERMTGRVSEDGTVIEQLKIRHEFGDTEWYELEIQNLPFWKDTMPDRFIVDVDNEAVPEYVVYFNSYRTAGYHWTDDARLYIQFVREF
jgi:hypothetical protein